jgi:hypothetical protein
MPGTNHIVGYAKCPYCEWSGGVKINKKNHLYFYCATPADGGCGIGGQSRSDAGDQRIAATIHKWIDTDVRANLTGKEPEPVEAAPDEIDDTPVAEPRSDNAPEPEPPAEPVPPVRRKPSGNFTHPMLAED